VCWVVQARVVGWERRGAPRRLFARAKRLGAQGPALRQPGSAPARRSRVGVGSGPVRQGLASSLLLPPPPSPTRSQTVTPSLVRSSPFRGRIATPRSHEGSPLCHGKGTGSARLRPATLDVRRRNAPASTAPGRCGLPPGPTGGRLPLREPLQQEPHYRQDENEDEAERDPGPAVRGRHWEPARTTSPQGADWSQMLVSTHRTG